MASREVAVQNLLVGDSVGGVAPCLRRHQGQQVRVHPLAGARRIDEQEAAVERTFQYRAQHVHALASVQEAAVEGAFQHRAARAGRGARDRHQGPGVPHLVQGEVPVPAAQQRRAGVEQLVDRPLEQQVAVAEQHLAVAVQAERIQGMERGRRLKPARIRGGEARHPVEQRGPDRLEAHAPAHRREDRARRLGQAVVEDDDVAGEPGMGVPERAEHDDGARDERIRDRARWPGRRPRCAA